MQPIVFIQAQAGSTLYVGEAFTGDLVEAEPVVNIDNGNVDLSGPMTSDQRRTLFAEWTRAFGRDADNQHDRHLFTTAVLGVGIDPSWRAEALGGKLTFDNAQKLLGVLRVVNSLL